MVNPKRVKYIILGNVVEFPGGIFMTIWFLSTFLSVFLDRFFFFGPDVFVFVNNSPGLIAVRSLIFSTLIPRLL
jgi:hypothetical protein